MPRRLKGIRRKGNRWEVYARIRGQLYSTTFPLGTAVDVLRDWRDEQRAKFRGGRATAGTLGADIAIYLSRVAAMATYQQRAAHLALWARALGRDRPRGTITTLEIDRVLQGWLEDGLAPATVRKRRTALQSFFAKMNSKTPDVNPVKKSAAPLAPKPEARALDYLLIAAAIAAMPEDRDTKPGAPRAVNLAKIRVRVLAYTGLPPGILKQIHATDLQLTTPGTVRVVPRHKGAGVEARTLPLTTEGLAAFKAFHAANAYGPFATEAVNRAFKRAWKRLGLDPRTVHLYDLRHSFLTELYQVTKDLATVGRLGLHADGSPLTARYAKGANQTVDAAAVTALGQKLATARQLSLKLAPAVHQAG